jgi:hypothetical protein
MPEYDYPPSSQMQLRGPFEEGGHFYVKQGYCYFEGRHFKTDFEIGYTQKNEVVIIAYLNRQSIREILGETVKSSGPNPIPPNAYTLKEYAVEVSFSGRDVKSGAFVRVNRALWSVNLMLMFDRAAEFIADDFECLFPHKYVERHIQDDVYSVTLANAPPQTVYGDRLIQTVDLPGGQVFLISRNRVQETFMSFYPRLVPVGVSPSAIADLFCAVVSLATATDIRWTKLSRFVRDGLKVVYLRRSDISHRRRANRILSIQTSDPYGSSEVISLFTRALHFLRSRRASSKSISAISKYLSLYIRYQVITGRAEDHGRLICTATEAFLERVESFLGKESGSLSDLQAGELWTNLRQALRDTLNGIPDSPSGRKREKIEDRFKSFINKDLTRARLKDRLLYCARQGQGTGSWINTHFKPRLEGFETTRNHIAHLGIFPEMSDDSDQWIIHYYQMLMIMPLLFFALIGYDGEYIDMEQLQRDHLTRIP